MNRRPDSPASCEQPHRRSVSSQNLTARQTTESRQRAAWSRMYRAHVEAPGRTFPELTVYVDADSAVEACGRIKQVCTAIGYAPRTEDEGWRIHEIRSAIDLLDTGNSALSHLRLFEKGSNAEGAPVWIRAPIFAIRDPLELLGLWSDLAHWKRR